MVFELRLFDTPLLRFSSTEDSSQPEIRILWSDEGKRDLLPLDLSPTPQGILQWVKRRSIPRNRAYVHSLLSKCGLSWNRPMDLLRVSKGLSLTDCYWVVEAGFPGGFDRYNLYDNRFSQALSLLAFTGYGSVTRGSLLSSPEFTTNGMLPKCWRRVGGQILLYKGGTSGTANSGREPYSEYYGAEIGAVLGVDVVPYRLSRWKGQLCSTCALFTSKERAFLPVGNLVSSGGLAELKAYYRDLGAPYLAALEDMLVLDAILCNTDRHLGNFGFLVDTGTNRIVAPAPLFDHGNSLFNFAGRDDWSSAAALEAYADTLRPCLYDGFLSAAKAVLAPRHRPGLRRLTTYRIGRHPRYNLPPNQLKLMEGEIHRRAGILLDF